GRRGGEGRNRAQNGETVQIDNGMEATPAEFGDDPASAPLQPDFDAPLTLEEAPAALVAGSDEEGAVEESSEKRPARSPRSRSRRGPRQRADRERTPVDETETPIIGEIAAPVVVDSGFSYISGTIEPEAPLEPAVKVAAAAPVAPPVLAHDEDHEEGDVNGNVVHDPENQDNSAPRSAAPRRRTRPRRDRRVPLKAGAEDKGPEAGAPTAPAAFLPPTEE
ncbi:MAG TPA: hypothetical protein DCY52_08080, partial [Methylococcaceae bacterium]|nr:hypothetical protein [Methylococcaceae bacterium]